MTAARPRRKPIREQIREAGGLYQWANASLISFAGPPQVGEGKGTPCHRCGAYKADHVLVNGELRCPE